MSVTSTQSAPHLLMTCNRINQLMDLCADMFLSFLRTASLLYHITNWKNTSNKQKVLEPCTQMDTCRLNKYKVTKSSRVSLIYCACICVQKKEREPCAGGSIQHRLCMAGWSVTRGQLFYITELVFSCSSVVSVQHLLLQRTLRVSASDLQSSTNSSSQPTFSNSPMPSGRRLICYLYSHPPCLLEHQESMYKWGKRWICKMTWTKRADKHPSDKDQFAKFTAI